MYTITYIAQNLVLEAKLFYISDRVTGKLQYRCNCLFYIIMYNIYIYLILYLSNKGNPHS